MAKWKVLAATALGVLFMPMAASAQLNSLVEGFDDITTLPGAGWFTQNNSTPVGTTGWFQGNSGVFPAHAGPATAYIAADFANVAGANTISNWLLTPQLNFSGGGIATFFTRTVPTVLFPDRLQVRYSTAGASTNVGTGATAVGDFTNLLLDINPTYSTSGYPNDWTQFTVNIPAGPNGRLAFRYFVEDGGPLGSNSDYIGIDTFEFTAIPEPGSIALLSMFGIGGGLYQYRYFRGRSRRCKS